MDHGETIAAIVAARIAGKIPEVFSPRHVNVALGITWAGNFLPKHRIGNPGNQTPLFVLLERGRYRLNMEYLKSKGIYLS